MRQNVILLEFNELSPTLMNRFINQGHLPNFKRFSEESAVYLTEAEERAPYLDPWIQWITVHTGLNFREHGIERLNEGHTVTEKRVWDYVTESGQPVWICGSMNVGYRPGIRGAVMPDPWTTHVAACARRSQTLFLVHSAERPRIHQQPRAADARRLRELRQVHGESRPVGRNHGFDREAAAEGSQRPGPLEARGHPRQASIRRVPPLLQEDQACVLDVLPEQHGALSALLLAEHGAGDLHGEDVAAKRPRSTSRRSCSAIRRWIGWSANSSTLPARMRPSSSARRSASSRIWRTRRRAAARPTGPRSSKRWCGLPVSPSRSKWRRSWPTSSMSTSKPRRRPQRAEVQLKALTLNGRQAMAVIRTGTQIFSGCHIYDNLPADAQLISSETGKSINFFDLFYKIEGLKSGMHHPDGMFWIRRPDRAHSHHAEKVPLVGGRADAAGPSGNRRRTSR